MQSEDELPAEGDRRLCDARPSPLRASGRVAVRVFVRIGVASHLFGGDGPAPWGAPAVFAASAAVSWLTRSAGRDVLGAVALAAMAAVYAVALFTLPVADSVMRDRAVEHGWIEP